MWREPRVHHGPWGAARSCRCRPMREHRDTACGHSWSSIRTVGCPKTLCARRSTSGSPTITRVFAIPERIEHRHAPITGHSPESAFDRRTLLDQTTSLLHVAHGDPMAKRGLGRRGHQGLRRALVVCDMRCRMVLASCITVILEDDVRRDTIEDPEEWSRCGIGS